MRRGDRSRPMLCVAAVALAATLLAACGDDEAAEEPAPAGGDQAAAQTFTIRAGEADESLQNGGLLAFYPSSVSVHPGDTLVFENGSGAIAIPHTVTLGTPADIPNRIPPPVVPEVGQVPAVWGQCVSDQPLDKGATDCPEGSSEFPPAEDVVTMPAFTSQSYYNSGIFDPGQSVEMEVDADPGTYNFFCYLHPATMTMAVDVVDAEEQIPTQQELDAQAEEQRQADLAYAQQAFGWNDA
jgi:plastocyanin